MVREFYPLLPQGPLSNGITPPSWRRRGESREGLVVPGVDRSVRWGRSWGGRGGGWLFPGGSGTITQRCNGPLCLCPQLVPPVPLSHPITCSPWTLQPLQKPKVAIRGGTLVLVPSPSDRWEDCSPGSDHHPGGLESGEGCVCVQPSPHSSPSTGAQLFVL